MQLTDIEVLPIVPHMSGNVKRLRRNAPKYVRSIIEDALHWARLEDLPEGAITALSGGMLSANYLVKIPGEVPVVIKMVLAGAQAEAEALTFWRASGANVVKLIKCDTVPLTRRAKHPIKYLLQEAVLDSRGRPARTCQDYVNEHPHSARKIGFMLGRELAAMHHRTSYRTFGEYADQSQKKAPWASWNKYLQGYLDVHQQYLLKKGVAPVDIDKLRHLVKHTEFSQAGRYIHGDFSMRNSMLASERPLKVVVFDPNPTIGDPSWDLAILYNNFHFQKRKMELAPELTDKQGFYIDRDCLSGLIAGYEEESGREINMKHVLLSQIMQTLFLAQIEERKLRLNKDPEQHLIRELEVRTRVDNLLSKIQLLIHLH